MAYTPTTWTEGVTKLGPTNMNHLEAGVQATAVVADAAIPKPNAPGASSALVWNGSSWVAAALVNANIDAAAAIAYSKLNLAGGIVNNDVNGSAAIAKSKLAALAIVDADVSAISASKLSGYPSDATKFLRGDATWASTVPVALDYVTATSDVVDASTVGATPTDILVGTSQAYAAGDYWVEFFCASVENTSGGNGQILVDIWDGATRLQQIVKAFQTNTSSVPVFVRNKVTLTAATHQIKIRAYHVTGAFTFRAGSGTAGATAPMFLRVMPI